MATTLTSALKEEYDTLFSNMNIRPERRAQIDQLLNRVRDASALSRYTKVEQATKVPWFVVAVIHALESSLRFDGHLHNGDPLTARTVRVPRGFPKNGSPPFKWQDSAIDALNLKKLGGKKNWTIADIAFVLEQYNGFGYRNNHPHVKSPYLWSFSDVYNKGKYVADGKFSNEAVSKQCGGMVLLRALAEKDPKVAKRIGLTKKKLTRGKAKADKTRSFPAIDGQEGTPLDVRSKRAAPPPYPDRYLRNGVFKDRQVEKVQRRLQELGISVGEIDGDFGDVTEDAVRLFQARFTNLDGEPLEMDGVVGPDTWEALFGEGSVQRATAGVATPAKSSARFVKKLLQVAGKEIGVFEVPPGSNRGPRVDEYVTTTGLNPAGKHAWCMCFVFWCFKQTAASLRVKNRVPQTGGVHVAWRESRKIGDGVRVVPAADARRNPALVEPGMVFFLDTGGGRGHTGIVAENRNGTLVTIEGNTNDGGSREGIGVFRRFKRDIGKISLGFCAYG